MGHLIYGVAPAIRINDWALRHLQAVMITKLRRGESFAFTWEDEPDVEGDKVGIGPGKNGAVWVSKSSSLHFSYDQIDERPLNSQWLVLLSNAASSNKGLRLLPEPK